VVVNFSRGSRVQGARVSARPTLNEPKEQGSRMVIKKSIARDAKCFDSIEKTLLSMVASSHYFSHLILDYDLLVYFSHTPSFTNRFKPRISSNSKHYISVEVELQLLPSGISIWVADPGYQL